MDERGVADWEEGKIGLRAEAVVKGEVRMVEVLKEGKENRRVRGGKVVRGEREVARKTREMVLRRMEEATME